MFILFSLILNLNYFLPLVFPSALFKGLIVFVVIILRAVLRFCKRPKNASGIYRRLLA